MKDIIQVILDYFKTGGVTLVRSLTLILLGYIFIQTIIRTLKRVVNKTHIDKTLPNFLISLFNIILIKILKIEVSGPIFAGMMMIVGFSFFGKNTIL